VSTKHLHPFVLSQRPCTLRTLAEAERDIERDRFRRKTRHLRLDGKPLEPAPMVSAPAAVKRPRPPRPETEIAAARATAVHIAEQTPPLPARRWSRRWRLLRTLKDRLARWRDA
jgi:hypothetical protein